ncbi:putative oxidoreductase [Aspergillus saccharolyticus JOP 1030-1]|uniref:Putative oxidoreductase n=1 Tax=Aspergillus saccharolyticus JOP 1030-1 TaxID=1450539 RepID=A0A319AN90_9EURO|nr:putative oxidoreductase [Aspergillus saccharolyticus JOP 1030-1]PYH48032.1 putative oxidoreductase [Aspergillus saccharolyticus JOP 1030-1]
MHSSPISASQIACLETVSLVGLREGSPAAVQALLRAARKQGIFYLDLSSISADGDTVTRLYQLAQDLFRLPLEQKMQYDVDRLGEWKINGYKPVGRNVGGLSGERDGFESYGIPCHAVLNPTGQGSFAKPDILEQELELVRRFMRGCTEMVEIILRTLSASLPLPGGITFEAFHREGDAYFNLLRLLRYEPSSDGDLRFRVPQPAHTDLGSVTVLFTNAGGLQILDPGARADEWLYVAPRPECAIVNLGDAISIWTDGQMRSIQHRVASLPGQPMAERYSLAFLARPGPVAPMCPLLASESFSTKGSQGALRCEDWMKEKFRRLRGDTRKDLCGSCAVVKSG